MWVLEIAKIIPLAIIEGASNKISYKGENIYK